MNQAISWRILVIVSVYLCFILFLFTFSQFSFPEMSKKLNYINGVKYTNGPLDYQPFPTLVPHAFNFHQIDNTIDIYLKLMKILIIIISACWFNDVEANLHKKIIFIWYKMVLLLSESPSTPLIKMIWTLMPSSMSLDIDDMDIDVSIHVSIHKHPPSNF